MTGLFKKHLESINFVDLPFHFGYLQRAGCGIWKQLDPGGRGLFFTQFPNTQYPNSQYLFFLL